MATRRRPLTDSPFDTLEKTFDLLVTGPRPSGPRRHRDRRPPGPAIPLGELKAMLLHPSTPFDGPRRHRRPTRRPLPSPTAGRGPSAWPGCSSPGCAGPSGRSCRPARARPTDIEAEALAAFLAAVARCQPGRPRLASRLCWLARNGATPAAARRAGRAGPSGHRPGLGRPAPAVGPPRPGAGQSRARRGDRRRRRRADRRHPHRRRRPGRGGQARSGSATRPVTTASSGRVDSWSRGPRSDDYSRSSLSKRGPKPLVLLAGVVPGRTGQWTGDRTSVARHQPRR